MKRYKKVIIIIAIIFFVCGFTIDTANGLDLRWRVSVMQFRAHKITSGFRKLSFELTNYNPEESNTYIVQ